MNYAGVDWESTVNGPGFRVVLYLQGCSHHCLGCHNEQTWDPKKGDLLTEELLDSIVKLVNDEPLYQGVTLSGGDPFFNEKELLKILTFFKEKLDSTKTIWCYTGYTYQRVVENGWFEHLKLIDTLIDGLFVKELNDYEVKFRGSSNQRILYLTEGIIVKEE